MGKKEKKMTDKTIQLLKEKIKVGKFYQVFLEKNVFFDVKVLSEDEEKEGFYCLIIAASKEFDQLTLKRKFFYYKDFLRCKILF